MALLEQAAGQGHAHAMHALGQCHAARKDFEQAKAWYTQAGLPKSMFNLGNMYDMGLGMAAAAPDMAAVWYRRAAEAGCGASANNLASQYTVGRGRAWQIIHATSSS